MTGEREWRMTTLSTRRRSRRAAKSNRVPFPVIPAQAGIQGRALLQVRYRSSRWIPHQVRNDKGMSQSVAGGIDVVFARLWVPRLVISALSFHLLIDLPGEEEEVNPYCVKYRIVGF